jgi:hypothetical protein
MTRLLVNIIGFYVGWFSCVLGAAKEQYLLGPLVVLVLFALHLKLNTPRRAEAALAGLSLVAGFVVDSVLVAAGVMSVNRGFLPEPVTSLWMAALWVNFAMTLNVALVRMQGHVWIAVVLGALGGPSAYYSGGKLGAAAIHDPLWLNLVILAVVWGVLTPVLSWLAGKLSRRYAAGS